MSEEFLEQKTKKTEQMRKIIREHENWLRLVDTGSAYIVEIDRKWWFGSHKKEHYSPVAARSYFNLCARRGWNYSLKNLL